MRVNFVTDFSGCAKFSLHFIDGPRCFILQNVQLQLNKSTKVNTYFRSTNREEGAGPTRHFPGTRQLTVVGSLGSDGLGDVQLFASRCPPCSFSPNHEHIFHIAKLTFSGNYLAV